MRVLISNKYYAHRGGDCIYTMELESLLKDKGHEVAIFAMESPQNDWSQWSEYFPSEISFSPRETIKILKALRRPIYSFEVSEKFIRLLESFSPNIVHLNNIHTHISPLIARIAHQRNIKVVWTLHDYKLLCPRYDCLRNGKPCELCFGNKINVLKYSCVKGSKIASFIAWLEANYWDRVRIESNVDEFICPSKFIKNKMEKGGFNSRKLNVLHNFVDSKKLEGARPKKSEHYCYVGRISEEKGIRTLLEVAAQLPYTLKILGTGPLELELREQYSSFHQIQFYGHKEWSDVKRILSSARFMVLPSECYENNPISAIESIGLGTPVLGANIGGIPEIVRQNETGVLFEPCNKDMLRNKIIYLHENSIYFLNVNDHQLSEKKYYEDIINIYMKC